MKDTLIDVLKNDTSYNKSATRYLYRTHPALWQQVLERTSFLPSTALAKQRVWHILNDVYEIPLCPIEQVPVKWWENRYLVTSSRTAKQKYKWAKGDYNNAHSTESNSRRSVGNKVAVARGRKYRSQATYTSDQEERKRITFLKNYGADNPSKSKIVQEKIYQKAITRGVTPREERSNRRLYYDAVWQFTEISWKKYFDYINPQRINRSNNSLDHIYSIQQGFRDSIPPYIIGHYTNLRVISLSEDGIKGMRCDKTQDELFDDFFKV